MTLRRIIVTDGHQRSALAIVRALGRRGVHCTVLAPHLPCLATSSRFSKRALLWSAPDVDSVGSLEQIIRDVQADVVIPVSDHALQSLLHDDRINAVRPFPTLGRAVLAAPDRDAYDRLSNKIELLELARSLGAPTPASFVIHEASADLSTSVDMPFPCVIKPHRSVLRGRTGTAQVSYAGDRAALASTLESLDPSCFPVLIQQRIVGPGEGLFLLTVNGETVARFAHRRVREYPPSGGASTLRESVAMPSDLLRVGEAIARETRWNGVLMIEFKRSASDQVAYLMEVNGRFWGSLQLAIDAGVDFPNLLLDVIGGQPPASPPVYREGVRTRWLIGDLDHLVSRLRHSRDELNMPHASSAGRLRALLDVLRFRSADNIEEYQFGDPAPLAFALASRLKRSFSRR